MYTQHTKSKEVQKMEIHIYYVIAVTSACPLWLTYCTRCNILGVHTAMRLHCPNLFCLPFACWWALGLLVALGNYEQWLYDLECTDSWVPDFHDSGCAPRRRTAGSHANASLMTLGMTTLVPIAAASPYLPKVHRVLISPHLTSSHYLLVFGQ